MIRLVKRPGPGSLLFPLLVFSCLLAINCVDLRSKLNHGVGELSVKLLQENALDGKNLILSGYGISSALTLLYLGAQGDTKTALQDVLGFHETNSSDISKAFKDTDKMIFSLGSVGAEQNDSLTLLSANALFANVSLELKPAYLETLHNVFNDATVESVDFATNGKDIRHKINSFVNDKTRGKIHDLLDTAPSSETLLAIINAVYFKGSWKTSLKLKDSDEAFNNFTCPEHLNRKMNTNPKPQWMSLVTKLRYGRSSELKAHFLELPYRSAEDTSVSMILVLPYDEVKCNFTDWVKQQVTWKKLSGIMEEMFETRIDLSLPKFKLTSMHYLNEPLKSLGLEIPFSDRASFDEMLSAKAKGVSISDFVHKAKMSVDELGTEAASASGLFLMRRSRPMPSSPPIELVFNRAFLSIIVMTQDGSHLPLFTSIVHEV